MNSKLKKKSKPMQNITINVPELYLKNIQKLIDLNLVANRSEAIRTAIREYLQDEFSNLDLLDFFGKENKNDL